jgi:hypothetical protein
MKKLSTLFLGLVIALSAVAAPQFSRTKTVRDFTAIQKHEKKIAKTQAKANGEVIKIEANNLAIDDSYNEMMIEWVGYGYVGIDGGTDEWYASGVLYPNTVDYFTTYSSEAEDIELAIYHNDEDGIDVTVSEATMAMTDNGPQFTATATDEEGNTYQIKLTFFIPSEPKDTVALDFGEATFLKYYVDTEDYYITGERPDYVVALDIFTTELEGTYNIDEFDTYYTGLYAIIVGDTVNVGDIYDAKAAIVNNGGVYNIDAELFLTDSILYQIHMTYTKPVATDTIAHTFVEPIIIDDYAGDFYFLAMDDEYALQMDYYSTTITGEFKLADMYEKYCGLYTLAGGDTTKIDFADLNLKVTEDATGYDIKVAYLGTDTHCYLLTLRSNKAVANDTVQFELDSASHLDVSEYAFYYGFSHYIVAAPADSSFTFVLAIVPGDIIGTFTMSDIYSPYSAIVLENGQFGFAEAEFEVTPGNNNSYRLEGWALAKNNVRYEFVIKTAEEEEQGIENIELTEEAKKVVMDGSLYIVRDGKIFNAQGARVR